MVDCARGVRFQDFIGAADRAEVWTAVLKFVVQIVQGEWPGADNYSVDLSNGADKFTPVLLSCTEMCRAGCTEK